MFSTILAYAVFILLSLLFVALIAAELTTSETQRELQRLLDRMEGKQRKTNWPLLIALLLLWAVSGIYLWG